MEFVRGDTASYKFQRHDANGNVITILPDAIYFTVKENGYSDRILIQKTLGYAFDEAFCCSIIKSNSL